MFHNFGFCHVAQIVQFFEQFTWYQFQVDVFEIEAVDLLNVTKVVVGHDGKEAGQGWYLKKVVVSVVDDNDSTQSWTFNCQRSVWYIVDLLFSTLSPNLC